MSCEYETRCTGNPADYHAELDGVIDADYSAETGNTHYGWIGLICEDCLASAKELVLANQPTAWLYYEFIHENSPAVMFPEGATYKPYPHPDLTK